MTEEINFILDSTKEAMANALTHLEKQFSNITTEFIKLEFEKRILLQKLMLLKKLSTQFCEIQYENLKMK